MGLQKIETLVPIRGTRIEASLGQAPYRWVGKLRDSLGGNCTAFLVGRDLIATAAHCVLKSNRQDDFYIGYRDNTFVDHARVVFIWVGTTSTVTKKGQDWALGRLDSPLGKKWGHFKVSESDSWNGLQVVGFGSRYHSGERMFWQAGCRYLGLSKDYFGMFFHNCDTDPGTSGAPLIDGSNRNFRIVGIHTGWDHMGSTIENRGSHRDEFAKLLEKLVHE